MTANASGTCQIILEKVEEDKQADTALFVSGCFSLPRAASSGIARSGPIAILTGLGRGQAEAILAEMRSSIPEGVDVIIANAGERARVSSLQWPRPPKVFGSPLDDFEPRGVEPPRELKCPLCGGNIRVTQDGNGFVVSAPGAPASLPPDGREDPLFSGFRPLAAAAGKYASIGQLQGGDTGFWGNHAEKSFTPPPPEEPPQAGTRHGRERGGTSVSGKKSGAKSAVGLATHMKQGTFAVILGRTKDAAVVKYVAEIIGLKESDAREKCLDLGLCVARDISLDEAQTLLARFRNLGAKARIVKPS